MRGHGGLRTVCGAPKAIETQEGWDVTEDERSSEGSEEVVEDLEAPAAAQDDVAGGAMGCILPSCISKASDRITLCEGPTCADTKSNCELGTHNIVVHQA